MQIRTHFNRGLSIPLIVIISAFISLGIRLTAQTVQAQTPPICPPPTLLSIARAGAACSMLNSGEACFGGGTGGFAPLNGEGITSLQPGDRASLDSISRVVVETNGDEEVSIASVVLQTSPDASDTMTVLLFGSARLIADESAAPQTELSGVAVGSLPIRSLPESDAELIAELRVNGGILVNGRLQGNEWLRVRFPETGVIGWAAAELINVEGVSGLPIVAPDDVILQPFGAFHLESGTETACDGALPSGALLQTPSTELEDGVEVIINGVTLRLAGTAFIRADGTLTLIVLDGIAAINFDRVELLVPAGAQAALELDGSGDVIGSAGGAEPYDAALTDTLPVNNLPRRFAIVAPLAQPDIDRTILALNAPTPTPSVPLPTAVDACRRSVGRDTTVWAGPGEDYEVLTELEAGTAITPVLETSDTLGATWWQLENSGWVALVAVIERGNCTAQTVPSVVRVAAPPTNLYSMERCESFNGPVRVGQSVTFEFIPPAWDSYEAARIAIQTDPGRFTFNADRYRAYASEPFPLGVNVDPLESRYLRRFTYVWTAQPGTFRIIGDWLTYEPSCNLTVTVE